MRYGQEKSLFNLKIGNIFQSTSISFAFEDCFCSMHLLQHIFIPTQSIARLLYDFIIVLKADSPTNKICLTLASCVCLEVLQVQQQLCGQEEAATAFEYYYIQQAQA
jgi:hypothetical protein